MSIGKNKSKKISVGQIDIYENKTIAKGRQLIKKTGYKEDVGIGSETRRNVYVIGGSPDGAL